MRRLAWTILPLLLLVAGCGGSTSSAPLRSGDRAALLAALPQPSTPPTQARAELAAFRGRVAKLVSAGRLNAADGHTLTAVAEQAAARLPAPAAQSSMPAPVTVTAAAPPAPATAPAPSGPPDGKGKGKDNGKGKGKGGNAGGDGGD